MSEPRDMLANTLAEWQRHAGYFHRDTQPVGYWARAADAILAAGWTPPRAPTEHELIEDEVNKLMQQEGWNGRFRHTLTREVVQPFRDRVLAGERAKP